LNGKGTEGFRIHLLDIQAFHPAVSASSPAPVYKSTAHLFFPADYHPYRTLRLVFDPSFQIQGPGLVPGSSPETDSLHTTVDHYVILNSHKAMALSKIIEKFEHVFVFIVERII
jgi:hypothetical protein